MRNLFVALSCVVPGLSGLRAATLDAMIKDLPQVQHAAQQHPFTGTRLVPLEPDANDGNEETAATADAQG